ncbi:MAG: helix-turn-helix domain-containing GNAT family N-acetyltransferase [Gemmatimonadaceae bacterium]
MADTEGGGVRAQIGAVRRFNRFYTERIGPATGGLLDDTLSLAEVRVLSELAQREQLTARTLSDDLGLDPGYLSRILRRFETDGLLTRQPSEADRRQQLLTLTKHGHAVFRDRETRQQKEVADLLREIPASDRPRLLAAMRDVESLLGATNERAPTPSTLRPPRAGDLGWVVHMHGVLYAKEFGWDESFEALVAQVVADFVRLRDRARDRCWIVEKDGGPVGCVFVVKHPEREGVAQLRLLLVDPAVRGLGIGRRLVDECIRFARHAGYRTLTLWTNNVLVAARTLYEDAGLRMVAEERHHSFGHDLVGQTWEMTL